MKTVLFKHAWMLNDLWVLSGFNIFNSSEARPDFELTFELYSCGLEAETTFVNTPKKLARKLRSSFGRSSGRKHCPLLDGGDPDTFLQSNPIPLYAEMDIMFITVKLVILGKCLTSVYFLWQRCSILIVGVHHIGFGAGRGIFPVSFPYNPAKW